MTSREDKVSARLIAESFLDMSEEQSRLCKLQLWLRNQYRTYLERPLWYVFRLFWLRLVCRGRVVSDPLDYRVSSLFYEIDEALRNIEQKVHLVDSVSEGKAQVNHNKLGEGDVNTNRGEPETDNQETYWQDAEGVDMATGLTKAQEAEIFRVKSFYPYRIAYGVIDKDTGKFEAHATTTMRIPNRLTREGHKIFVLK